MVVNYSNEVKNRLKRVEGQVRGILRMMDEEKDCKDVTSQLSAARTALDRSIALIVAENLQKCVTDSQGNEEETSQIVKEAIDLLVKSR
ncbi:MAG TPA: metal-sensitive transcriptional regulator [Pseudogracilibacillus sp.]|nr:metal-sensitive transcriptional regulator [Pseudogracilibacillus sp.]